MSLVAGVKQALPARLRKEVKESVYRCLDLPDYFYRLSTGQAHLPPYSLRRHVGRARDFYTAGEFFLGEFNRYGLIPEDCSIFDIGCGVGRLAYTLATDAELRRKRVRYVGMDVDERSIRWAVRNITPLNRSFSFYRVDLFNKYYNAGGLGDARQYRLPHEAQTFDLIVLTSVFTHLLEDEVRNFCREIARMLKPGGTAYTTFFTYRAGEDRARPTERRDLGFPFSSGNAALASQDYPEAAVAYEEGFLLGLLKDCGLRLDKPIHYGFQDAFLLRRADSPS
jgi:SAM-dependent methyltransferase